jgi:hypothetical protein
MKCEQQGLIPEKSLHSDEIEVEITKQAKRNKPVTVMRCPLSATSLLIPKIDSYPELRLSFIDMHDKDKALLYRVVVAAYNYAFLHEFAALSSKDIVRRQASLFVQWLNTAKIANRHNVLKEYEAYMFDKRNNHGGSSALVGLKTLFTYAFENEEFYKSITTAEHIFLQELIKTKISPNLNKKQISLASYFGALDWLRDESKGVGVKLYNVFASPKLTVASLKCLASVLIIELHQAKVALRAFLLEHNILQDDFDECSFKDLGRKDRGYNVGCAVYDIFRAYHVVECPSAALETAMALVTLSNAQPRYLNKCLSALDYDEAFRETFLNQNYSLSKGKLGFCFKDSSVGIGLPLNVLHQLADPEAPYPVTTIESLMFTWLMSSLTVQPSDIPKLTKNEFRLFKVGGKVTSIESEYFKGRANAIHSTRTLSVKKIEGKALLTYLEQHPTEQLTPHDGGFIISSGVNSVVGMLMRYINLGNIDKELKITHQREGDTPMIMPLALKALVQYGVHTENVVSAPKKIEISERRALVEQSGTPCQKQLFALSAIKNSAVHAYSDPYTLHYLINRNSHTNQTEKDSYLTADNEEWMNACGRVTRSVMLDLINNVFDLNFSGLKDKEQEKAKVAFNTEFASVTESISYESEEMFARLQVITGQEKGVVNEIGVLSHSATGEGVFAPIYVLDSPVTVCKMRNYIHEFEQQYKKLLCSNPDFLYQTVLPTVEWMERVLSELSRESLHKGEALFKKMKSSDVSMSVFHSI